MLSEKIKNNRKKTEIKKLQNIEAANRLNIETDLNGIHMNYLLSNNYQNKRHMPYS